MVTVIAQAFHFFFPAGPFKLSQNSYLLLITVCLQMYLFLL